VLREGGACESEENGHMILTGIGGENMMAQKQELTRKKEWNRLFSGKGQGKEEGAALTRKDYPSPKYKRHRNLPLEENVETGCCKRRFDRNFIPIGAGEKRRQRRALQGAAERPIKKGEVQSSKKTNKREGSGLGTGEATAASVQADQGKKRRLYKQHGSTIEKKRIVFWVVARKELVSGGRLGLTNLVEEQKRGPPSYFQAQKNSHAAFGIWRSHFLHALRFLQTEGLGREKGIQTLAITDRGKLDGKRAIQVAKYNQSS